MRLNGRLAMIAERIPKCNILADIGTDHAYIPIYAVEKGLCGKSLAADIRKGPLEMANANIRRHGMHSQIETRLGNGLEPISTEECDTIVIAGMGGSLIKDILSMSAEKAQKANLLLLQPNNAADVLRKWLYECGFEIIEEALAHDAGKLYCMISAKWSGKTIKRNNFDYYVGDMLLISGDPLVWEYIEKKIKELNVVIDGRSKSRIEKSRNNKIGESTEKGREINGMSMIAGMTTEECSDIRDRLKAMIRKGRG